MDEAAKSSNPEEREDKENLDLQPVLFVHNKYPIYLDTDWSKGIGGGLWSTGLALAYYFSTDHCWKQLSSLLLPERRSSIKAESSSLHSSSSSSRSDDDNDEDKNDDCNSSNSNQRTLRVLELGSGNGFLSVCLIVAIKSHLENERRCRQKRQQQQQQQEQEQTIPRLHVVVTDTAEHLILMKKTIDLNMKRCGLQSSSPSPLNVVLHPTVTVKEYLWGNSTDHLFSSSSSSSYDHNQNNIDGDNTTTTTTITKNKEYHEEEKNEEEEEKGFDLIFGSDLAYRDDLHDPLIDAFQKFTTMSPTKTTSTSSSTSKTIILLGVTMIDTKPIFFHKLNDAGFYYERLADHLVEPQFRGQQFGLFLIWKKKK